MKEDDYEGHNWRDSISLVLFEEVISLNDTNALQGSQIVAALSIRT